MFFWYWCQIRHTKTVIFTKSGTLIVVVYHCRACPWCGLGKRQVMNTTTSAMWPHPPPLSPPPPIATPHSPSPPRPMCPTPTAHNHSTHNHSHHNPTPLNHLPPSNWPPQPRSPMSRTPQPHTPIPEAEGGFSSGPMEAQGSFAHTFDAAGSFLSRFSGSQECNWTCAGLGQWYVNCFVSTFCILFTKFKLSFSINIFKSMFCPYIVYDLYTKVKHIFIVIC